MSAICPSVGASVLAHVPASRTRSIPAPTAMKTRPNSGPLEGSIALDLVAVRTVGQHRTPQEGARHGREAGLRHRERDADHPGEGGGGEDPAAPRDRDDAEHRPRRPPAADEPHHHPELGKVMDADDIDVEGGEQRRGRDARDRVAGHRAEAEARPDRHRHHAHAHAHAWEHEGPGQKRAGRDHQDLARQSVAAMATGNAVPDDAVDPRLDDRRRRLPEEWALAEQHVAGRRARLLGRHVDVDARTGAQEVEEGDAVDRPGRRRHRVVHPTCGGRDGHGRRGAPPAVPRSRRAAGRG
ncbi:MAG: hypothetical protein AAFV86_18200 [Pseudomonadota bacterium]